MQQAQTPSLIVLHMLHEKCSCAASPLHAILEVLTPLSVKLSRRDSSRALVSSSRERRSHRPGGTAISVPVTRTVSTNAAVDIPHPWLEYVMEFPNV